MTDQHPLTEKICADILPFYPETEHDFIEMRAAADWQWEQVVQWNEDNLLNPRENRRPLYVFDNYWKTYKEFDYELIDRLTQAMRPTQEDNNE